MIAPTPSFPPSASNTLGEAEHELRPPAPPAEEPAPAHDGPHLRHSASPAPATPAALVGSNASSKAVSRTASSADAPPTMPHALPPLDPSSAATPPPLPPPPEPPPPAAPVSPGPSPLILCLLSSRPLPLASSTGGGGGLVVRASTAAAAVVGAAAAVAAAAVGAAAAVSAAAAARSAAHSLVPASARLTSRTCRANVAASVHSSSSGSSWRHPRASGLHSSTFQLNLSGF
jgi:hypothetical protein